MGKWLVLLIVIWLIFWVLRSAQKLKAKVHHDSNNQIEDMVQCRYCEIHVPKKEAIVADSHFYCCPEHYQLYSQSTS
mgnify:CR=1 FL=1|jgi:uncharacterized protein